MFLDDPAHRPVMNRPVPLTDIHQLVPTVTYRVQPKLDGWRVLAGHWQGETGLLSRTGKPVACSQSLLDQLRRFPNHTLFDGELLTDAQGIQTLHAFDLLWSNGVSLAGEPLFLRQMIIQDLLHLWPAPGIQPVPSTQVEPGAWEELAAILTPMSGEEGRVIKARDGTYMSRWYKVKFVKRITGILTSSQGESGSVSLWNDTNIATANLQEIAGLKIPIGLPVGSLVEVEYLRQGANGRLVQPIFKGLRSDVLLRDCTMQQLGAE